MINMDNPQFAAGLVIAIAFLVPVIYGLFVDNHKKGTPDPRKNTF